MSRRHCGAVCLFCLTDAVPIVVMAGPIVSMAFTGLSMMTLYNHLSFDGGPVCDGQRWMWVGGRKKVVW